MKALIISPQPFFTPRGTPFSVYYRTLIMRELGVEADLLTYGQGQDVDIPGVRVFRIPRFPFLGHIKVGPSPQKVFLDVFMLLWTIRLLSSNRYDIVHAHEEAVFYCRFLKPIFGFKLIYDMHSSLPQQLTNFQFTTSRVLISIFKKLEDACLRASDAVITICPDLFEYARELMRSDEKLFLIENSIFDPIRLSCNPTSPKTACAPEEVLGLPQGRRLVTYAGTLEPYQGIDILIRAFKAVIAESPDAFLLVIGGTRAQTEHYMSMAREHGILSNALFTGSLPPELARYCNRISSVLVSPRSRGTNTPLKIYEQLASRVPLVATSIHSHIQVLDPDIALLVKPDSEDMARGILAALDSGGRGQRIAQNASRVYEERYSRRAYTEKMQRLLESLSRCAA